jgi:hypothetical protein
MKTVLKWTLALAIACDFLPGTQAQKAGKNPDVGGKLPNCTESLPNLAVPDGPHGLFAILFPNAPINAKAKQYLLHNPVVCGANFYAVWSEVDKGPGASPRYDWSRLDEQMEPWIAAGKEVNLIVWATGYNARAHVTPDHVFSKVDSIECPNFGRVPVFWEKGFMREYQAFMAAVVQKYGKNSALGYIRFGLGAGGETFPACMYALKNKGFTPGVWRQYTLDMLDYEKSLNSPKQLMVGINTFGNPPDFGYANAVAKRAIENGIAIGSQGWSIRDRDRDTAGEPCEVDWCHIFREAAGKVPLELQTLKQSNADRSGPIGSMVELLPFALRFKVQIFEIYLQDWLIAYDPGNPDYGQYHQQYQEAYEAAAKIVGGR